MNIFKVCYEWYEGEYKETLLGKEISQKEFEKDLTEARDFAKSLQGNEIKKGEWLGEGYSSECLPQYYENIIWFLTEKKFYVECEMIDSKYSIDNEGKEIEICKFETEVVRTNI